MKIEKWFDLAEYGIDLKLVRVPSGKHLYMMRDAGKDLPLEHGLHGNLNWIGAVRMGFGVLPGNSDGKSDILIKGIRLDEEGRPESSIAWGDFMEQFPKGRLVDFDPARDFIDKSVGPAAAADGDPAEEEASGIGAPRP